MKSKRNHVPHTEALEELRHREKEIAREPSTEGYLRLADAYRLLGLGREADRLLQLAEALEGGGRQPGGQLPEDLLSGSASPVMLVEMIQIVGRTHLTGDFVIDAPNDTFRLFFDQGQIINASSDRHAPGYESFCQALRVPYGSYHFVQKPVLGVTQLIDEKTDILLIKAMQEADEEAVTESHP